MTKSKTLIRLQYFIFCYFRINVFFQLADVQDFDSSTLICSVYFSRWNNGRDDREM